VSAFVEGVLAGYGIAIPVGPIAVLIIGIGTTSGLRRALFAGLGAALADLFYATIAVVAGAATAAALAPYERPLRLAAAVVLVVVAVITGTSALRSSSEGPAAGTHLRTTLGFLSLTLMNPVTLTYFAALILGSAGGAATTTGGAVLFVAGAFLASLSWQMALAAGGAILGHRMPENTRAITGIVGALVILALAIRMLLLA
jgi:arginine exporter protein ArgO